MKPTRIFTKLNNLWLFRDWFSLRWLVESRDRRSFPTDKKCLRIQGILVEFQKLFPGKDFRERSRPSLVARTFGDLPIWRVVEILFSAVFEASGAL